MTQSPDPVSYLDQIAASTPGRAYKDRLLTTLELRPGLTVVEVGCGPGTDLAAMAAAVGPAGRVIGIDHDPAMVAEARRRLADTQVSVRDGDAHRLPLDDACADRVRTDRVVQHVEDPARVLGELARVLRPGGLAGLAEPDWDTLVIDDPDVATSRAFTRFLADKVRNGTVGRRLARLAAGAGLAVRSVEATAVVCRDVDAAEQILGLRRNTDRGVRAGVLPETPAQQWFHRLTSQPFLASFTFFTVVAAKPPVPGVPVR
jgi:ubiquinone/menaquinone biosynthesis C-methylase UbiE